MSANLSFLQPLLLIGLVVLPLFWLLLNALPPEPILRQFPPIGYLLGLRDETAIPQKIPLWLRLLRLLMVVLLIVGFAGPIINPPEKDAYQNPILVVIDDGWANAGNWDNVRQSALAHLRRADLAGQQVALVFSTATNAPAKPLGFSQFFELQNQLKSHELQPFAPDRTALATRLQEAVKAGAFPEPLQIYWISDGLDYSGAASLIQQLSAMGKLQILLDTNYDPVRISDLQSDANGLNVTLTRQQKATRFSGAIVAEDKTNAVLGRESFKLETGEASKIISLTLPLELRNRMSMVRIVGLGHAGAVQLVDSSWVKPNIGIVGGRTKNADQPLLSGSFYLTRALAPYSQIRSIDLNQTGQKLPPILILLDTGKLAEQDHERLSTYVQNGGFLIRFSGPRLAARQDDLVPVRLRFGGRLLGSALGWDEPQQLRAFADTSPFFGLDHTQNINVSQQVLADSVPGLADKVWARLEDGTPLVTASNFGRGHIVLFHVTAAPGWSELPLSGLFVQMLKRLFPLAKRPDNQRSTDQQTQRLDLKMAIRADGRLHAPTGTQEILDLQQSQGPVDLAHPAGLWSNENVSMARNVTDYLQISSFPTPPKSVQIGELAAKPPMVLAGILWLLALGILLVDSLAILWMGGKLSGQFRPNKTRSGLILLLITGFWIAPVAGAKAGQMTPFEAAERTRLSFVITGNDAVDKMSEAGLRGISRELYLRTTVEPAEPQAIDLEQDDIAAVSLLYWPIVNTVTLSDQAAAKLNSYLKNGGMLVLDTQDGGLRAQSSGGTDPALASLFERIDIPSLQQVPSDHVLTRSYYLIQNFAGRYANPVLWVEAEQNGSSLDGVSSLVIGSHDWAAAWAIDRDGQPLAGLSGEIEQQREMARRFGINLVMYVLAGNYKADQVHIPALLERLGK